jgi:hypothetical protein
MKLPRRISELLKRKEQFLLDSEAKLNTALGKMQGALVSKVTAEIIPLLDVSNGVIRNTLKNYRLLASLDRVYADFQKGQRIPFVEEVGGSVNGIVKMNVKYFQVMMGLELPEVFESVSLAAAKRISVRLGLEGGKIVSGGFFETLIKNEGLLLELKQFMSQAVTAQVPMKDFIKGLNTLITGDKDKPGGIEKQFNRYAHDIYMQYDSAYSTSLATEIKLNYFVYQGGLVRDSRDFCVANNNHVFKREDTEKWRTWTPEKAVFPEGYKIKQRDKSAVPSYISYPGYQPLIDRGGFNCRHYLGWVTDGIAEKLQKSNKNNKLIS